ncbi:DUF2917 domain-containing protein [Herbaspirillum sp. HC18]|nr:DUF2917 domain-containing protein [Herbaspirillum sp. HC18]
MDRNDHLFMARPISEDIELIAARARRAQSRALGDALAGALRFFTSYAAQFVRTVMKPPLPSNRPSGAGEWIRPNAPLVLQRPDRETITCDMGTVWITQGDSNDYVLEAGQSLTLHPRDEVLVTAMRRPALIHRTSQVSQPNTSQGRHAMTELTPRERELVALGAAMGSNCAPCVEFHVPAARKAGLSDEQISEAIAIADKVRQVPARKVLNAALGLLSGTAAPASSDDACNGSSTQGNAGVPCCA